MNIPELKEAMEMVKGVLEDDQSGCGCSYKSDAGKAINTLLSSCQLLCDVSEKMLPAKIEICKGEHKERTGKWVTNGICNDCGLPVNNNPAYDYYNTARSEDILWLTKKMMGLEEVIREIIIQVYYEELHPLSDKSTSEECNNRKEKAIDEYLGRNQKPIFYPVLHAKVDKVMSFIINAIRQEMGICQD